MKKKDNGEWGNIPTADRYVIQGKKYVCVWEGEGLKKGHFVPLEEYLQSKPEISNDQESCPLPDQP